MEPRTLQLLACLGNRISGPNRTQTNARKISEPLRQETNAEKRCRKTKVKRKKEKLVKKKLRNDGLTVGKGMT